MFERYVRARRQRWTDDRSFAALNAAAAARGMGSDVQPQDLFPGFGDTAMAGDED